MPVPSQLDTVATFSATALLTFAFMPFPLGWKLTLLAATALLGLCCWLNPWRDHAYFPACTAGERRRGWLRPRSRPLGVVVSEEAIVIEHGGRKADVIAWHDLQVFYLRASDGRELVFANDVEGGGELLRAMHKQVQGFDDLLFIQAMGCTSNRRFRVWERPAAGALPAAG
jgi:hypothetical protein